VYTSARSSILKIDGDRIAIQVRTEDGRADVGFEASQSAEWQAGSVFPRFEDAFEFFRRGDCGFSCSLREGKLDGLQLKTLHWEMRGLQVDRWSSAFFEDEQRFPRGAIRFDCALLMRGVPHEWHEITDIPELAGVG
jgi:hypothetical protein